MITKEAIEAACAVLNGRDKGNAISIHDVVAMLTAAFAAMPGPAVRVEYANRSTGGFAPAPDLASENERLRKALEIIVKGDVLVHDEELHCDVTSSMSEDEMRVIAKAALEDRT